MSVCLLHVATELSLFSSPPPPTIFVVLSDNYSKHHFTDNKSVDGIWQRNGEAQLDFHDVQRGPCSQCAHVGDLSLERQRFSRLWLRLPTVGRCRFLPRSQNPDSAVSVQLQELCGRHMAQRGWILIWHCTGAIGCLLGRGMPWQTWVYNVCYCAS